MDGRACLYGGGLALIRYAICVMTGLDRFVEHLVVFLGGFGLSVLLYLGLSVLDVFLL